MNTLIIIGKMNCGKSTTIRSICKELKSEKVYKLKFEPEIKLEESDVCNIHNDVFILEKDNKNILVVSGAPTELNISFTKIYEACLFLKRSISFAIIAKRTSERKKGYNTISEVKNAGFINIIEEKIQSINESNFEETEEWKNRIEKLTKIVLNWLHFNNSHTL